VIAELDHGTLEEGLTNGPYRNELSAIFNCPFVTSEIVRKTSVAHHFLCKWLEISVKPLLV